MSFPRFAQLLQPGNRCSCFKELQTLNAHLWNLIQSLWLTYSIWPTVFDLQYFILSWLEGRSPKQREKRRYIMRFVPSKGRGGIPHCFSSNSHTHNFLEEIIFQMSFKEEEKWIQFIWVESAVFLYVYLFQEKLHSFILSIFLPSSTMWGKSNFLSFPYPLGIFICYS